MTYELASKLSYFLWNGPPDVDDAASSPRQGRLRENSMPGKSIA